MPGNGFPNSLDAFLGDVVRGEELTGGVRTIDLEALVFARELLDDVKIVECGGYGKEFRVETQFLLTALLSREQVHSNGMVNEQIGGMLSQESRGLFREQWIGNEEGGTES